MSLRFPLLLVAALHFSPAVAHQYQLGSLVIEHPWSRPTAPGMPMGVAYLSITNNGNRADVLIAASTPAAAQVQMHQTTIVDGMARMRPLAEIAIPAGATVKIEPGGIHLMLVDLKAPFELGRSVPLELTFRNAGKITVALSIETGDGPPSAENSRPDSPGAFTVPRGADSLPAHAPGHGITVARGANVTDREEVFKVMPASTNLRHTGNANPAAAL
jgi:copper(I)-binding protein